MQTFKYKVGMYGGSFDPLHLGHVNDMIKAASMCKELYIVLSYSRDRDYIPMEYRYRWILNSLKHIGNAQIILLEDKATSKDEYNNGDYWVLGANEIKEKIGKPIDVVFCGDDYAGTNRYEALYPESKVIYFDRNEIKISSTLIKRNPFKYWDYIPEIVRPYFTKKILLVGGESTGKSTLSQNLALIYNTKFLPEMGRFVCEEAGTEDTMIAEDLHKCLLLQKTKEYEAIKGCNKLLFVDTDALITKFFIQFLLKDNIEKTKCETLANAISDINKFDLVLFLEPTVDFVQDGTRNEKIKEDREKYSQQIKDILNEHNVDFVCIDGDYSERLNEACRIINNHFF